MQFRTNDNCPLKPLLEAWADAVCRALDPVLEMEHDRENEPDERNR